MDKVTASTWILLPKEPAMKLFAATLITAVISLPLAAQPRYEEQTKGSAERPADPSITLPADHAQRSALLTGKVKAALAGDVGLHTLRINVDSEGSVVTLKGVVDSDDTRRRAEQVASAVAGVSSVNNQLSVRRGN
jgi:BON domain-containing protein